MSGTVIVNKPGMSLLPNSDKPRALEEKLLAHDVPAIVRWQRSLDALFHKVTFSFALIAFLVLLGIIASLIYGAWRLAWHRIPTHHSIAHDILGAAKTIERVGDHSTNIVEYVIYVVEGRDIRHTDLDVRHKERPV